MATQSEQSRRIVRESNGNFSVHRGGYFDREIFDRELRELFGKTWLFLAHESEVPDPGDYVTRRLGADAVIVVRDENGNINVLGNTCRHRGVGLCRSDRGNSSHFRCSYHGWTYANTGDLVGVTAVKDMYGKEFDKSRFGLYRAAQVETFCGLIFATWSAEAPTLRDYLGDAAWYLEASLGSFDEGLQVFGPPIRTLVDTNWKAETENLGGDGYHTPITHQSAFLMHMFAGPDEWEQMGKVIAKSYKGRVVDCGGGHTFRVHQLPVATEKPSYFGYPPEFWPEMTRNLDPGQIDIQSRLSVFHGNIFPNLTFIDNFKTDTEGSGGGGSATRYIRLTQQYPIAPDVNEMLWWGLSPKALDPELRQQSQRAWLRTVGPAGLFQIDDNENFVSMARGHSGPEIGDEDIVLEGGLQNEIATDVQWRGKVYDADKSEQTMRAFWREWSKYMETPENGSGA